MLFSAAYCLLISFTLISWIISQPVATPDRSSFNLVARQQNFSQNFSQYIQVPALDPGFQYVPSNGQPNNTFNNGAALLEAEPPNTNDPIPDVYGMRNIDIPFGRLFNGTAKFFPAGQLNTPAGNRDYWYPNGTDSASQSACGIPDNAYFISKVAIHPYFLKFVDLSRYCMQDVCVSFWANDGSSDMILKVTDICTTDPADPTYCATPADIKMDRTKMMIMQSAATQPDTNLTNFAGNEYAKPIWWFFSKCWDDALAQPAYQGNNNWFTTPALPNNENFVTHATGAQAYQNAKTYPAKGWIPYPNGAYNTTRVPDPLSDWIPGSEPAWSPVAGGKGFGIVTSPSGNGSSGGGAFGTGISQLFDQCGGELWQGPTTCANGTTCQFQDTYYSQCDVTPSSGIVQLWDQCGGELWKGPTACANGTICHFMNTYYSQCDVTPSSGIVQVYDQCGGSLWKGLSACVNGTSCQFLNAYYSQCRPDSPGG